MPAMMADYHIHTRLCRHAEGEPRDYVEHGIRQGLPELGFADHLPFVAGYTPAFDVADDFAMGLDELDGYVSMIQELAREYRGDIRILLGIEADYIEETLEETAAILDEYPFDYVIGSVHIIGDRFPFDHPDLRHRLSEYGVDRMHLESLGLVAKAAGTGLFDIMGHIDQAKVSGLRPVDEAGVAAAASAALRAIAAAGIALELNTAGWRKPAGEAYPAPAILREAAELGIPLTFGSDAHRPAEVGYEFARAAQEACAAGYSSWRRLPRSSVELPC